MAADTATASSRASRTLDPATELITSAIHTQRVLVISAGGSRAQGKAGGACFIPANRAQPPTVLDSTVTTTTTQLAYWTPGRAQAGQRQTAGIGFLNRATALLRNPPANPTPRERDLLDAVALAGKAVSPS